MNLPAFIELEQPIHYNRRVINDFEMGRYNQDLECGCKKLSNFHPDRENDKDESNFFHLYSFLS